MVVWGAGEGEGVGAAPCASAARPRLALPPAVDAPLNPTPRHPPQAALDWAGATDTAHADTRLLVAVVWASGDASHPTIDRARSWAACSGFELVRAAPADAGADAALAADDEGVPRIAATLEARHWPGMVMKAKVGGGERREAAARGSSDAGPADAAATATAAADPADPAYLDLDGMDALLAELATARSTLAGLPDAERRAGAAAVAARLAAALGLEDDENEGDSASEE